MPEAGLPIEQHEAAAAEQDAFVLPASGAILVHVVSAEQEEAVAVGLELAMV